MFGRRVTVLLRLPAQTRLPATGTFANQYDLPIRTLALQPVRTYATPGRPRSVVGEPTKTVKRAVKRQAAKATSSEDSPAKKKNEAKKESAAKKPAAKKKPAKKDLTEEQKAVKAAKFERAKISDLKKAALSPPKVKPGNAWTVFFAEKQKDVPRSTGETSQETFAKLGERTKSIAAAWKERSVADTEHYNHLAHTAREASQAEFKRWVESHTPEAIDTANRARQTLRRKLVKDGMTSRLASSRWPNIHDERRAKRPLNAYLQFNINRQASGDFRNIGIVERAKQIAQEYRALNEDEKNKYKALEQEDQKRYESEYMSVYGRAPSMLNGSHAQPAAVAAAAA